MARPVVGATAERLYARLPEYMRIADAAETSGGGYPFLRYISLVVDQAGSVENTLIRADYYTPYERHVLHLPPDPTDTSDLVDPLTADSAWLPWIGRLVGVEVTPDLSDAEKRDAVAFATSGFRAGTKTAVADAAKTALTGTRHVEVYDHSIYTPGDGGPWDVLLVTRGTETPDVAAVLATVVRKNAKPAGVMLHHRAYSTSWDTVTATYPTWNALEAAGSWDKIQEAGL